MLWDYKSQNPSINSASGSFSPKYLGSHNNPINSVCSGILNIMKETLTGRGNHFYKLHTELWHGWCISRINRTIGRNSYSIFFLFPSPMPADKEASEMIYSKRKMQFSGFGSRLTGLPYTFSGSIPYNSFGTYFQIEDRSFSFFHSITIGICERR